MLHLCPEQHTLRIQFIIMRYLRSLAGRCMLYNTIDYLGAAAVVFLLLLSCTLNELYLRSEKYT